ncbi:MAG TPA: polysaccharide deacetylase family protein [Kofleriaceae bacterium]|jgi:hypothetical protein
MRCPAQWALGAAPVIAACATLIGCADLTYDWDERRVLCSTVVDDISDSTPWRLVEDGMLEAEALRSVLLLHAHAPGVTISVGAIERLLTMAESYHLAFLTFRELQPGAMRRAGLALAFDDNAIDAWFSVRDRLAAHGAHVTFFVTRWYSRSDSERAELRMLADAGHDVEPHSVNHLHAPAYVHDHGLDAYLADEVAPSIDGLTGAGYPPADTFAFPFGDTNDEITAAVLRIVPRVRVSPGGCPK